MSGVLSCLFQRGLLRFLESMGLMRTLERLLLASEVLLDLFIVLGSAPVITQTVGL